ncbi:MAG TPA: N-acetyltransferase family protein [Oscillospiraceae bacterium]|nr:N-acetyltransferase family protein [Oscillospiraceae bacterium]
MVFFTGNELMRFAAPDDAEQMLAIYAPYIRKTAISFEYEVPSLEEFRGRVDKFTQRYPWLVYERDGEILGYAYGSPNYTRAAYNWTVESSIYLREDCRGTGVGQKLYTALLECLTAMNFYVDYALINASNEVSLSFHKKFGFREVGRFVNTGYKLGTWQDTVTLEKVLREPEIPPLPILPINRLGFDGQHPYILETAG